MPAPQPTLPQVPGLDEVASPGGLARAIELLGPEPRACLLCGSPRLEKAFFRNGKWFWSCGDCRLVFVHALYPEFLSEPEELERVFAAYGKPALKPRQRKKYDRLLAELEPLRRTNRLLEVGCGTGNFMVRARDRGWRAVGVDTMPEMIALAEGLDVHLGNLADVALPDGSFDAVVMIEVIEHVIDPVELLLEVHRVLRPGGVAFLQTGNSESWSARLRRGSWWYFELGPYGHIRFFGPSAAEALARAAGFASAQCTTHGFAFLDGNELSGRWYKVPVKLAQAPLSFVASLLGAGHSLTMRLRKGASATPVGA